MDNNQNETVYSNQPSYGGYQPQVPEDERVMTMGDWILTLLVLMFIPCVNVVMMFVWGFGNGNQNRKNFCRAFLIMYAIAFVLGIIMSVTVLTPLFSMMSY